MFGKQIQKALEMAEKAGRDAAEYNYKWELKELKLKQEREIEKRVNESIANLDYSINPEDVLTASYRPDGKTGLIFLNKEQLGNQEVNNLKQEVKFFQSSRLWKIINATVRQQAQTIMFTKSASFDDMKAGKSILRTLDVQDNILKTIDDFK